MVFSVPLINIPFLRSQLILGPDGMMENSMQGGIAFFVEVNHFRFRLELLKL